VAGRSTRSLAVIPHMSSRRLFVAIVAISGSLSVQAQDYVATWEGADAKGNLALELDSDGHCSIALHDNANARDTQISCTYWLHGSRIKLRTKGQRGDEGLGEMDLEYVPQSDTVIIHGPIQRVLTRQPGRPIKG